MNRSRILFAIAVALVTLAGAAIGFFRLDINTDVIRSLPADDTLIANGLAVFENHPLQDRIAIDVAYTGADPDLLAAACAILEERLTESGLFAQVGSSSYGELIPGLANFIATHLPLLFAEDELLHKVAPLLDDQAIHGRINTLHDELASMEGVGQARLAAMDPLGLKDLVMARLATLAPTLDTRLYKGRLLSDDRRHMLVTAKPLAGGTDTEAARKLTRVIELADQDIQASYGDKEKEIRLTAVGAFRAALDNEQIIRGDVRLALLLTTGGIGLLLLVAFPRPWIGLLSLLPALAGMGVALFVYSLFNDTISIMVLGFGSAIISITVDHGVVYLLFLDRRQRTLGHEVSSEVRSVGIMAVITSIGAFGLLSLSSFPIFTELGRFTALGIFFSYLFVHWVFPKIFPDLKAGRRSVLPLRSLVGLLYRSGKTGAILAAVVALGFVVIAKPRFHVSLSSMNTVSEATLAAETLFASVWGDMDKRVYFMGSAPSIGALQEHNDRLLQKIEDDIQRHILNPTFSPSMIFPGKMRGNQNLQDWKHFWSEERRQQVVAALDSAAAANGFTPDAFAPFIMLLGPEVSVQPQVIPPGYFSILGISERGSGLVQYIDMNPGERYESSSFFSRYRAEGNLFDADLFTSHLAALLCSTFTLLFWVIASSVAVLLFVFYLDVRLTVLTLLPPAFAYICTLGTLHLLGRPLDIPSLMLSVVILGMGIDYSIFCVRAHQRYRDPSHPFYILVYLAVFIAGSSTLIGFGVLCLAEHSLLKSIGITSFFGIGYSMVGAFLLLPPLLARYLQGASSLTAVKRGGDRKRVAQRYRTMEAYPRMFVRCKIRLDPLFHDLERLLAGKNRMNTIVDIGCGYGVPACWCLEYFPHAKVYGLDPDPERVRVAAFALHGRGSVVQGFAPQMPPVSGPVDLVLLLDMLHYLDEDTLTSLVTNCRNVLRPDGLLVTRFVIRPEARPSFSWLWEDIRIRFGGGQAFYRTQEEVAAVLERAGFLVAVNKVAASNPELVWMSCQPSGGEVAGAKDK